MLAPIVVVDYYLVNMPSREARHRPPWEEAVSAEPASQLAGEWAHGRAAMANVFAGLWLLSAMRICTPAPWECLLRKIPFWSKDGGVGWGWGWISFTWAERAAR